MLFCKGKCIIISLLNGKSSEEFFLEYFGTDMLLLLFTVPRQSRAELQRQLLPPVETSSVIPDPEK